LENYDVLYFKALVNQDTEAASICLQELFLVYQKIEKSVGKLTNKLAKCFASKIHELYRFVKL